VKVFEREGGDLVEDVVEEEQGGTTEESGVDGQKGLLTWSRVNGGKQARASEGRPAIHQNQADDDKARDGGNACIETHSVPFKERQEGVEARVLE
jgi:hypothetical protein